LVDAVRDRAARRALVSRADGHGVAGGKPGIRILRAVSVDAVMQVDRPATRVAGVSGVTDDVAGLDTVAFTKGTVAIEMRVVMPFEPGSEDPHYLAAEVIRSNAGDDAARRTQDWRVPGGKDVDAWRDAAASAYRVSRRLNLILAVLWVAFGRW
jgi:hypothetical protein